MDYGTLITVGFSVVSGFVGAVVWLVRLEGKINALGIRSDAADKRIDGLEERIFAQLDRIESRLFQLTAKD